MTRPILIKEDQRLHPLIEQRRSIYAYSDEPIGEEQIQRLFEAAHWAASSRNEQPWRFVYATHDTPELYQRIFESLNEGNRIWAGRAPLLIASLVNKYNTFNGTPNAYAWHDLGLAIGNLTLQATDEGLYLRQMGGFNRAQLIENLEIPAEFEPVTVLAVGYPGDVNDLPEMLRQRQLASRQRKPLEDLVFHGKWDNPVHWD